MSELNDLRRRVVDQSLELTRLRDENAMLERDNSNLRRQNGSVKCRNCANCAPDRVFIRCLDWGKATDPDGWCYKFKKRKEKKK